MTLASPPSETLGTEAPAARPANNKPRLPMADLRRLCRRSDLRCVLSLTGTLAAIVGVFAMVLRWPGAATGAAAFVLIGGLQHRLSIVQHEANHYLLFRNRAVNESALSFVAWLIGFTRQYRRLHLRHHSRLGHEDDPDLANYEHYPAGLSYFMYDLVASLTGFAALKQFLQQSLQGRSRPEDTGANDKDAEVQRASNAGGRAKTRQRESYDWEIAGVALTHLALLSTFWALGKWHLYVLLWILPLLTLTKTLAHLRNVAEHTLTRDIGDAEYSRYRTILCNPIEAFFFAPLHFNYHAEHHMYPAIPYFNLPTAHRLLVAQPQYEQWVDLQRGYVRFLLTRVVLRGKYEKKAASSS